METEIKKHEYKPNWIEFLFLGTFCVLSFYYDIWWGGLMFGYGALLCFPNQKAHSWIMQQISGIKALLTSLFYLGLVLAVVGVIIWFVVKVFNGVGNIGKYEGQTAEEWYYDYSSSQGKYQTFRNCVEDYDSFDIATQIDYGGVFYYCE